MTGKGGVGKTSVACALAIAAAEKGSRVLLCETDSKGAIARELNCAPLEFTPTRPLGDIGNLFAISITTQEALEEYVRIFVRIPLVTRLGVLAKTLDFVADAAPGVKEVLTIGKVCYEVREKHYDLVIVDAESTGHVVSQIASPQVIRSFVQVGLLANQTTWMTDLLSDTEITGVVVVAAPEESPVDEAIDLIAELREKTSTVVSGIIANRVQEPFGTQRDRELLRHLAEQGTNMSGSLLRRVHGAQLALRRRDDAVAQLERLRVHSHPTPTITVVPNFDSLNESQSSGSQSSVARQIALHLADELLDIELSDND